MMTKSYLPKVTTKLTQIIQYMLFVLNVNLLICGYIYASDYNNSYWQALATTEPDQIEQLMNNKTDPSSRGWLELAKITKNTIQAGAYNNNKDMVAKIAVWQQKYPNHPALLQFPELKQNVMTNFNNKVNQKIAILLPITGSLNNVAQAITKGILTASYQDENPNKPELFFIDTYNKPSDIVKYYNEALDKQADLIIGPLEKESVTKLKEYIGNNQGDKPTIIALNYIQDDKNSTASSLNSYNFYQIGISAEDEAEQAAIKSINKNHKRSLLLIDNNDWSQRISRAYKAKLEQLGGKVLDTIVTNDRHNIQNLVTTINTSLGITQSQQRKVKLQATIKEKVAFQPRHRQDVDNIFIMTAANQARQVKPMLKYYYADDIPIIATSQIYDYKTNNYDLLKDLDGVLFCDIPLLLHNRQTKSSMLGENNTDNYVRLYALGMDVYNLSYNINPLRTLPNVGLLSNIGHLYLDQSGKIHRQLPWALIKNGNLTSEQNNWT